jgi:hypothetical protein
MTLQIDSQLISDDDHAKINEAVSRFRQCTSVVNGIAAPKEGWNAGSNHLVLSCVDGYVLSIKKQRQSPQEISRELFMKDASELLGLHHYRITKQSGLPIPNWSGDYIKIEWGKGGRSRRPNFNEIASGQDGEAKRSVMDNIREFVRSYAAIFAMNLHFGISDRKVEHFLWDLEDKMIYSIDNELTGGDYRESLVTHNNAIKRVIGATWFDDPKWRKIFEQSFLELSEKIRESRAKIQKLYADHCLTQDAALFDSRVGLDPKAILSEFFR